MKNKFLSVLLIPFIIFMFCGCSGQSSIKPAAKSDIGRLAGDEYTKIDKIVFMDGTGRNKDFTLNDKRLTAAFLNNYINKITIKEISSNKPYTTGWARRLKFYSGDKLVLDFTVATPLTINNKYYKSTNSNLSISKMDSFIKSANPHWKVFTQK